MYWGNQFKFKKKKKMTRVIFSSSSNTKPTNNHLFHAVDRHLQEYINLPLGLHMLIISAIELMFIRGSCFFASYLISYHASGIQVIIMKVFNS